MRRHTLRTYLALSVFIFLLAFVSRVTALHQNSFWVDEAFTAKTIDIIKHGGDFVEGMAVQRIHMPLYYVSLLWYPGDHTDFSLRFASVLLGLLTIAMTMRILSHIYGLRGYALLTGFILAIHMTAISQARTARMYPLVNFSIAIASYLFLRFIDSKQHNQPNTNGLLFYITSMLVYLTHVATLMLIPAQFMVLGGLAIKRRLTRGKVVRWMILQILILIPTMLWVEFAFDKVGDGLSWIDPLSVERVITVMNQLFIGGIKDQPMLWHGLLVVPVFIALIINLEKIKHIEYWLGLTLVPFVGLLIVSPIRLLFTGRYLASSIFAYIVILILSYHLLDDVLIKRFKKIGTVAIRLLIGAYLLNVSSITLQRYQNDYFAQSYAKTGIEYVQQIAKGGDRVIGSYFYELIDHYLDDKKFWLVGRPYSFTRHYEANQEFPADRVWLIAEDDSYFKQFAEENKFNPVYQHEDVTVYFIEADG